MNNDISQKLRLAIKSKLTTLDAYIDDEVGFQYSKWPIRAYKDTVLHIVWSLAVGHIVYIIDYI